MRQLALENNDSTHALAAESSDAKRPPANQNITSYVL